MIGQMSAVTPLTGGERAQRSSVEGEGLDSGGELAGQMSGGDVTTFSPAALALSRNVPPAGASAEQGSSGANDHEKRAAKRDGTRLDIRV